MLNGRKTTYALHLGSGNLRADAAAVGLLLALSSAAACAADHAPAARMVPDLEALCRPEVVQTAVAKLSPTVTVKEVSDGPKLLGGAKFTAATKDVPPYRQVTRQLCHERKDR